MRCAEPTETQSSMKQVTVTVEWYSKRLGYGFGIADDDTTVFIHRNALSCCGLISLNTDDIITCQVVPSSDKRQVAENISSWSRRAKPLTKKDVQGQDSTWVKGKIKFYNSSKGYGFLTLDDENDDIYFSQRAISFLNSSQMEESRVKALVVETNSGFRAIEVLPAKS